MTPPACLECEHGQRPIIGPLDAYTPPADLVILCRCPLKKNGRCTCRYGGQ